MKISKLFVFHGKIGCKMKAHVMLFIFKQLMILELQSQVNHYLFRQKCYQIIIKIIKVYKIEIQIKK